MMRKPADIEVGDASLTLWNTEIFLEDFCISLFFLGVFYYLELIKFKWSPRIPTKKIYTYIKNKRCIGISNVSIRNKHKSVLVERKKELIS